MQKVISAKNCYNVQNDKIKKESAKCNEILSAKKGLHWCKKSVTMLK